MSMVPGAHEPPKAAKECRAAFDFIAVQLLPYKDVGNTVRDCRHSVSYQMYEIKQTDLDNTNGAQ